MQFCILSLQPHQHVHPNDEYTDMLCLRCFFFFFCLGEVQLTLLASFASLSFAVFLCWCYCLFWCVLHSYEELRTHLLAMTADCRNVQRFLNVKCIIRTWSQVVLNIFIISCGVTPWPLLCPVKEMKFQVKLYFKKQIGACYLIPARKKRNVHLQYKRLMITLFHGLTEQKLDL